MRNLLPDHPDRLRRLAAAASLSLAALLSVLKLVAALATGSLAVLSSLIDSLADIVASSITVVSVQIAQIPADGSHRFGHGKAESLSALAQSALIAGSAVFVLIDAVRRLSDPQPLVAQSLGLAVMVFAMVATVFLVMLQRHVVRRTGSQAINADSVHYRADLLTNLSVVVSLLVTARFDWPLLDPLIGAAIAVYLGWHAYHIGQDAVRVLMDQELPRETRQRIMDIVLAHPEVRDLHDLRTRESGATQFIELHVEVDGAMTVADAHEVTDAIEAELFAAFPAAEVILHQEPAGLEDDRLDHRIAQQATTG